MGLAPASLPSDRNFLWHRGRVHCGARPGWPGRGSLPRTLQEVTCLRPAWWLESPGRVRSACVARTVGWLGCFFYSGPPLLERQWRVLLWVVTELGNSTPLSACPVGRQRYNDPCSQVRALTSPLRRGASRGSSPWPGVRLSVSPSEHLWRFDSTLDNHLGGTLHSCTWKP